MTSRFRRAVHTFPLLVLSIIAAACPFSAEPQRKETREIYLFVDQRASISPGARVKWVRMGQNEISKLRYGDSIRIFAIHDNTLAFTPVFSGATPCPKADTSEEKERARKVLLQTQKEALEAWQQALTVVLLSQRTDVLSAFERLSTGPNEKKVEDLIFSDMLQCDDQFNFELQCIADDELQTLIRKATAAHDWQFGKLHEVVVKVVLPSAQIGDKQSCNSVRVLRRFDNDLISGLGGKLASFDAYLEE